MPAEMIPPYSLVLVKWDDAWQDSDNFASSHGIAMTHKPLKVETLGWLIKDDELGVSVVNERTNEDGEQFRGRTFIPRAMIRDVIPFKLVKPRHVKTHPVPIASDQLAGQTAPQGR